MGDLRSAVFFRVDASPEIGMGHLRRCLTLASKLLERGWEVWFMCKRRNLRCIAPQIEGFGVCWLVFEQSTAIATGRSSNELLDAAASVDAIERIGAGPALVVVDSYELGYDWERRIGREGHRIVVLDDYRHRRHHADVLISDSEEPFDPRLNMDREPAMTLHGRRYALVAPEYAFDPAAGLGGAKYPRLVVSYGGADATGETLKALQAVDLLREDPSGRMPLDTVQVVVGPLNSEFAEIKRMARRIGGAEVHHALPGLAPLLRHTDIFLTAGGNSLVEALALRTPSLVTITAENQARMVLQLAEEGIIRSVGWHDAVTPQRLAAAIATTFRELDVLRQQIVAKAPFDHLGADRIANAMSPDGLRNHCDEHA